MKFSVSRGARLHRITFLVLTLLFVAAAGECKKTPPAKPVDLNTANAEQLEQIPGIGPGTAKAIVQFREKSGPLQRVDDLLAIRGITPRKLNQLRPYVIVVRAPSRG